MPQSFEGKLNWSASRKYIMQCEASINIGRKGKSKSVRASMFIFNDIIAIATRAVPMGGILS